LAPPQIIPVDTVGAGDTFVGALAVLATQGDGDPATAVRLANAAAALSTQRRGAQEGMPTTAELARYDAGT
ncbi:MAG: PfkB family carbohydrate kinase, partial [Verrucomicrobiales bacterium]